MAGEERFLAWLRGVGGRLGPISAKKIVLGALGIAAAGALFGAGVAAGAALEQKRVFARASQKMQRMWLSAAERNGWVQEEDARPVIRREISTTLFDLEETVFSVGPFTGQGGSIAQYRDGLVFVEPSGRVGYASFDGAVRYIGEPAPMRQDEFMAWMEESQEGVFPNYFRAMDALVLADAAGRDWLYVSHQRFEGRCVSFVISRIEIAAIEGGPALGEGWEEVFVAEPCVALPPDVSTFQGLESGGRMIEAGPGRLLVTTGQFGYDGIAVSPAVSQDPAVHLGKILEIDLATGRAEVYSMGHRNPQGLAMGADGRVWMTEHGPKGGDEVNLVVRGGDYGWPATTYGLDYGTPRADWPNNAEQGRHDERYILPKLFYSPSNGISNLVEAPADEFPLWRGDLLVGVLEGMAIHRLRLVGDDVISDELIPVGGRVRDIIVLSDNRLALLTDGGEIRIWQRKRGADEPSPFAPPPTEMTGFVALASARREDAALAYGLTEAEQGRRLFAQHCASCHSMGGPPAAGPDLRGVMGREVAGLAGYDYSPALRSAGGRWSHERLYAYIADPQGEVPGTRMAPTGVHFADIEAVIQYFYEAR